MDKELIGAKIEKRNVTAFLFYVWIVKDTPCFALQNYPLSRGEIYEILPLQKK
jgi:hypothetical protein